MDSCERQVDITVLVVDDDTTTLSIIASILRSWEYKVVTAINAQDALKTLREFSGFFDLVITDLNMPSMNGFELLKLVKEEFQLPVIMMSADTRKSVMSKSLAKGAAFYIVKPVCRDDFKDIWQYAVAGRKEKFVAENELMGSEVGESSGEKITSLQDVNSAAPSPVAEPKRRGRYGKRKGGQLNKEDLSEGSSGAPKKPKVVWTNSLHNQFLLAIRQIGLNKAVPKRILEIMNVPGLTRENVASHLQKYRIFLRKVAERGILEGLTDRALRSSFASGLPTSLIKDIQRRILNMRLPLQRQPQPHLRTPPQYSSTLPQPSTPLADLPQFPSLHCPNPSNTNHVPQNHHQAFNTNSLNQVRLGSNFHHPVSTKAVFPAYGSGGNGFMTSANGLTGGITMNYGGASMHNNNNYGSLGNSSSFNYSGSPGNSGNQLVPFGRSNYYGIQLNGGSLMAGMDQRRLNSDNSFGLINGTTPNAVSNGNYGLSQGWDASAAAGNVLPSTLNMSKSTLENVSGLLPLPQQLNDNLGNAGDHGHDQNNVNPVSTEDEACQFDENLTELFLMLDDMHLLKEREDNPNDVSEFWNSDFPNSFHAEQLLEQQSQGGTGDVSAPSTESSINLPNKSPTPSDENPNKLLGNDGFADLDSFDMYLVDKANSSASISQAAVQDWDMDLIESLFGSEAAN